MAVCCAVSLTHSRRHNTSPLSQCGAGCPAQPARCNTSLTERHAPPDAAHQLSTSGPSHSRFCRALDPGPRLIGVSSLLVRGAFGTAFCASTTANLHFFMFASVLTVGACVICSHSQLRACSSRQRLEMECPALCLQALPSSTPCSVLHQQVAEAFVLQAAPAPLFALTRPEHSFRVQSTLLVHCVHMAPAPCCPQIDLSGNATWAIREIRMQATVLQACTIRTK